MKTLVVGLGNPILTDDGVGVLVAQAVKRRLFQATAEEITVTEASLGGLRLMEMMIGYDRLILVDALNRGATTPAGQIHRLTLDDLRSITPTQHTSCGHDTNLITALDLGRELGYHLPHSIIIYGIGVSNVTEFGDTPTPSVAKAIPVVADHILDELNRG